MNKKIIIIIIIVIITLQAIQLTIWVNNDNSNPAWDQSGHAMISLNKYNHLLGKTTLTTEQIENIYPIFRHVNNYYPPLFHISAFPFYMFLGDSYDSALFSNLIFLLILIISSFFIGNKLHSSNAGLLIAFILSTVPIYSSLMRDYLIDFSLSAMVSLGLAFLLYSENFENLKYSLLFGLVLGLGILTKWTYPAYLIIFILYSIIIYLKRNFYPKKNIVALKNIFYPFLISFFLVLLWYTPNKLKILIPNLLRFSNVGALEGDPSFSTLQGLFNYFFIIIRDYSLFYFIFFIFGMGFYFIYNRKKHIYFVTILQILFIYILFTFLSNKDARFIAPIYVFMTVLTGLWIFSLQNQKIKYSLISLIVIFGLFQNVAFNSQIINGEYYINKISVFNANGKYAGSEDIDIKAILESINADSLGEAVSVCIISESASLNDFNIPYFALEGKYAISYMIGGCNPLEFDYAILSSIEDTWRSNIFEKSKIILVNEISSFKIIYSDDGVAVYKKII